MQHFKIPSQRVQSFLPPPSCQLHFTAFHSAAIRSSDAGFRAYAFSCCHASACFKIPSTRLQHLPYICSCSWRYLWQLGALPGLLATRFNFRRLWLLPKIAQQVQHTVKIVLAFVRLAGHQYAWLSRSSIHQWQVLFHISWPSCQADVCHALFHDCGIRLVACYHSMQIM